MNPSIASLALITALACPAAFAADAPAGASVGAPPQATPPLALADPLLDARALTSTAMPLLPVWISDDGHVLALAATAPIFGAALPPAPATGSWLDWRLVDPASIASNGLRLRVGDGLHADVLFGSLVGSTPCALPLRGACGQRFIGPGALGASVGLGWSAPNGTTELLSGISWLQSTGTSVIPGFATAEIGSGLPLLTIDGGTPLALDSSVSLFAGSRWRIGSDTPWLLDLGASYSNGHLQPLGVPGAVLQGIELNQASLSMGIGKGALRGMMAGRLISADDPLVASRHWTTLDLGVSWRTPWQGEIRVGAQNLWSQPLEKGGRDQVDPAQARMPYIQYRQDL
jgi:hypothetical protein